MNGFLYGVVLQWKLDIRSKSLLVTCYIVPLIFFLLMGGIFTSVMPDMGSMDLCQYFGQKKLKAYAAFFNSSSSFC